MKSAYRKIFDKSITMLIAVTVLAGFVVSGCGSGRNSNSTQVESGNTATMASFSINGSTGVIDNSSRTISVAVPFGTSVSALVATFSAPNYTISIAGTPQISGVTANDFRSPVTYSITGNDGITSTITATVTVATSSAKSLTSFSLNGVSGTIYPLTNTIGVVMPFGTDLSSLIDAFTTSGSSVSVNGSAQISGTTSVNYSSPVLYVVSAADATTSSYTVTVTVAPSDAKSITSFSLDGVAGTINSATKAISVVMPFGTSVTSLIETFTTTGSQVSAGGATQVSGLTSENYTSPVIYVVSAADASTSSYTVTVSIAPSSAKLLAAYSLSGVTGIINNANKTISVYLPYGSSVIDLIATFTTTGATINVGGTPQVSSTTSNNFTLPVVYTVTASDASTASYTVTVTLAPSNEKLLTAFSISGIAGTINQATKEINVVMPRGTSVTALIDTFSTTGASIAVGTTNQISGTTINNFTSPVSFLVTAVDGSTSSYTVNVTVTVAGPPTVALGNAGNFVLFANTGMSSAVNSTITGNVGVGPAVTSTAITTGFTLTPVGAYATAPQVTGKVYAYDYAAPTPSFIVSSSNDMLTAYNDARGRLNPDFTNVAGGNLSGISLEPGLYKWTTSVNLTAGSSVTLNGGPNDVWILQIAGTVTTGAGSRIVLTGGALPKNIFWQLDTALTMGASSIFNGIVLTGTAVTVGANSTVNGRFLAQTAITMDSDTITEP
jgi:Ice-binding-like